MAKIQLFQSSYLPFPIGDMMLEAAAAISGPGQGQLNRNCDIAELLT